MSLHVLKVICWDNLSLPSERGARVDQVLILTAET